jgi:hypothetical protein
MYSAGFISLSFSAVRIYAVNYTHGTYLNWVTTQFRFSLWSVIEPFSAVVCVNIPTLFAGAARLHSKYSTQPGSYGPDGTYRYGSYGPSGSYGSRKDSKGTTVPHDGRNPSYAYANSAARSHSVRSPVPDRAYVVRSPTSEKMSEDGAVVLTREFAADVERGGKHISNLKR